MTDKPRVLVLSRAPGHLIRRAQQVHTALWVQRLHGELTGPQYAALVVLAQESGVDQSRLAERASLDKNTAGDVVRRLAAHGWIDRVVDPADGRRRVLTLNRSARAALRHITPAAAVVQQDLLTPVPAERRERVVDLLASVARAADLPAAARQQGWSTPDRIPVLALARTPGYLIRRAQQVHGGIWAATVGTELTGPQYAVLAVLAAQPGADQVTVGRLASLDKSSASDVVRRLVRDGWLQRVPSEPAVRRVPLHPTPHAWARLATLTPLVEAVQAEFLSPLAADKEFLVEALAAIAYRGAAPYAD